jgi:hypothetical protein
MSLAAIGVAALALGAAACGGSGEEATAGGERLSQADVQEAGVEYARCMREQGFDVPDPKPGGGGVRGLMTDNDLESQPGYRDAERECRKHLEGLVSQISDGQREQFRESRLEFARCMRDEGFDVPDPKPGGGPDGDGGMLGELDQNDPRVQEALDRCRAELPTLRSDDE